MNKQIQELIKQATVLTDNPDERVQRLQLNPALLVELVVKKFDNILILQKLDCIGNNDKKSAELIEKIRDNTKTYFGVEK